MKSSPILAISLLLLAVPSQNSLGARPFWDLARAKETPHPAVVRIVVPDGSAISFGSGSLVAVTDQHGLVVTNWHVVQDSRSSITVVFPDGFRSQATVLATDRDWDLAALAIWRPRAQPIPLATAAPQPGQALSIAGYGSGDYRTDTGRCTQYVAPGPNHPYELLELSATARQGDSGGPIFNDQGELAGVLFGSTWRATAGSYCGRVRWFLDRAEPKLEQLRDTDAAAFPAGVASVAPEEPAVARHRNVSIESRSAATERSTPERRQTNSPRKKPADNRAAPMGDPPRVAHRPSPTEPMTVSISGPPAEVPDEPSPEVEPVAIQAVPRGSTRLEQIKTLLAIVGFLSLLFHGMRLLCPAEEVEEEEKEVVVKPKPRKRKR